MYLSRRVLRNIADSTRQNPNGLTCVVMIQRNQQYASITVDRSSVQKVHDFGDELLDERGPRLEQAVTYPGAHRLYTWNAIRAQVAHEDGKLEFVASYSAEQDCITAGNRIVEVKCVWPNNINTIARSHLVSSHLGQADLICFGAVDEAYVLRSPVRIIPLPLREVCDKWVKEGLRRVDSCLASLALFASTAIDGEYHLTIGNDVEIQKLV